MDLKDFDFEKDLSIDKFNLDKECISHPGLYFRYADAMVEAKSDLSRAEDTLKLIYAERNVGIRERYTASGTKFTESLISSELDKDAEVLEARVKLREKQIIYEKIKIAVDAMDARKSQLDNLVKLYVAGFFSVTQKQEIECMERDEVSKAIKKGLNKEK